jgi:integrase
MRRFNLYRRGKFFYVRYWDERTQSYSSGKSTREADERNATATAVFWDKFGIPDEGSVQNRTDVHAIIETARRAPLEQSHVRKLIDILVERKMLAGATLADDGASSKMLIEFLKNFWTYEQSPYVAEKLAYGQTIGRRHCDDSLIRLSHWERLLPHARIGDVTRDKVREVQMNLSQRGLAAKTINAIIDAGTVPLRWLHDRGEIPNDPTDGLRRFSGESKSRGILTTEEIGQLFSVPWYDDRSRVASLVAATCGLRAGEVLALRPGDIGEDRLFVRHSWSRTGELKDTKTGESREVPLLPEIRSELLRLANENPHGIGPGRFLLYGLYKTLKFFGKKLLLNVAVVHKIFIIISKLKLNEFINNLNLLQFHQFSNYFNSKEVSTAIDLESTSINLNLMLFSINLSKSISSIFSKLLLSVFAKIIKHQSKTINT